MCAAVCVYDVSNSHSIGADSCAHSCTTWHCLLGMIHTMRAVRHSLRAHSAHSCACSSVCAGTCCCSHGAERFCTQAMWSDSLRCQRRVPHALAHAIAHTA